MPDFNVIANVSETMVAVLNDALKEVDPLSSTGAGGTAPVALLHDLHSAPTPPREEAGVLAVTLVEAREDATTRNRPRVRRPNGNRMDISKPAMAWNLRYLLTPWSRDLEATGIGEERQLEHKILGCVARALYDGAIISGNDLRGQGDDPDGLSGPDPPAQGLEGSSEALKVTLAPLTFEEQTRFWHAVQQKYRVSLTYDVRVVNLESTESQSLARVSSREIQYGLVNK